MRLVSLRDAREKAQALRLQLYDGADPIAERRSEKAQRRAAAISRKAADATRLTFAQAAERFFAIKEQEYSSKHSRNSITTLETYAFPLLGELPVTDIDVKLVLAVLEPIWAAKTVTAKRVRARIEWTLDWATAAGHRTGDNPARWRGNLAQLLPKPGKIARVKHHAALPFNDVHAFLEELASRAAIAARALEFTILTAARTNEVLGARWPEIDFERRLWIVPPERTKTGKEHRVPLAERTLKLLRSVTCEKGNEHVFIGTRRGARLGKDAMGELLERMGREDITVHGFRSTFRDWAAETTHWPNHVVEMALAHTIASGVEAAYRRGDLLEKRRVMMAEWADYCSTPRPGEVVPMRRAAK